MSAEETPDQDDRSNLEYPFIGIGVVVWKGEKFLLIQRGKPPGKGQWSIPGGRQERGETVKAAAVREVFEETGLTVAVTNFLDVIDSIRHDEDGKISFHATLIDYAAEWISGDAQAGSDAMDVAWHGLDELAELGLWSETERIIRQSSTLRLKR